MKRPRGQALAEFLIIVPVLVLFLVGLVEMTSLVKARYALIGVCREAATYIARNDAFSDQDREIKDLLEVLGRRRGLKGREITYELKPIGLKEFLPSESSLGDQAPGPFASMGSPLLGQRLVLRYQFPLRGLLGRVTGGGVTFEENVALLANPWRHPLQQSLTSSLSN